MKDNPIHITFHNPNSAEELADELVKIAAETAAEEVRQELLHSEYERDEQEVIF